MWKDKIQTGKASNKKAADVYPVGTRPHGRTHPALDKGTEAFTGEKGQSVFCNSDAKEVIDPN